MNVCVLGSLQVEGVQVFFTWASLVQFDKNVIPDIINKRIFVLLSDNTSLTTNASVVVCHRPALLTSLVGSASPSLAIGVSPRAGPCVCGVCISVPVHKFGG